MSWKVRFWSINRKIRKCGLAYKLEIKLLEKPKNAMNNVRKRYYFI
jgi:hypothetical protein